MNNKKYNVTITQTQPTDSIIAALAKLFKISPDKAEKILQKKSFVIKKSTDKATAEKFHKAICAIKVNCQIDETPDIEDDIALPEIKDIKATDAGRPLIDITRPDITPLHSEHAQLTLADGPQEKSDKKEKIRPIDNVDPENFCPECGTIRASANSHCIHCDYDPIELNRSHRKSIWVKLGIFLIVLGIGAAIAFPYYQQYAKQLQIQSDLELAFDARNRVAEFILQTNFWPNQNIDAGLNKQISNPSLKSVMVGDNAVITVTLRAEVLDGKDETLIFIPNTLKGRIVWNCLGGSLPTKYRPKICQVKAPAKTP